MDRSDTKLMDLPTASLMERVEDLEKRTLRMRPNNFNELYAASVAKGEDRVICEQGFKLLPRSLTELISLSLRDEGNALIEETRQINNRYAGSTIRTMQANLVGDLEVIDLKDRLLDWAERVAKTVLFKVRRQISQSPIDTYAKLYQTFIHEIDVTIAHGEHHMYSLVWSPTMDSLPYWLIDGVFIQTGLISGSYDNNKPERTFLVASNFTGSNRQMFLVQQQLELYGYAPTVYSRDVVLTPLLQALKTDRATPAFSEMKRMIGVFLADLLEAFPYLLTSKRIGKNWFAIPGANTVGAFDYTANNGFGRFFLSDSTERLTRDLERAMGLGILEARFDGGIAFYPFPWMTLERLFGEEDGTLLTYWLFKQAHERVVVSYLKINRDYLDKKTGQPAQDAVEETEENDYLQYTEWVREAQELTPAEALHVESNDAQGIQIPQMRRSRFFKLLGNCGVSIEQGKGSELKLLKANAHPFRMGSHYGPNPTVPSFLIVNVLKRLQISHDEWRIAITQASSNPA